MKFANEGRPRSSPGAQTVFLLLSEETSPQVDAFALGDEHEDLYRSEREFLLKRRNELGDLFDKGRVTLASGALALTFALLRDDLGNLSRTTVERVGDGAIVMAVCLLLSVLCVYAASQSFDRRVDILDDDRRAGCGQARRHGSLDTPQYRRDRWADVLAWLNPISLIALAVGIVLTGTGVFAALSEASPIEETNMESKDIKPGPGNKGGGHDTKSLGGKDRPVVNTGNTGNTGSDGKTDGGEKK